ncbi:class I SAM-dependent methyltransferase [Limnoglobus roseus]|uniref:Homocysteine methyltransferase n=1 Tax=Limnoglobus roseus TaxID=2598579 RepID=A0A5C1AQI0_9BACT|nr:class I SAM-dependent methyltransferase [Limnoglobus roseus]QEL20286.1 homocysteine methyltransferase [Limnoglobus roseus]
MPTDITPPDPSLVLDYIEAFRRSKTMFAAVSLGLFDALAGGPKTGPELALTTKTHEDTLIRLLNACVGLGLLTRDGQKYANTPAATAYLTTTSPLRMTGYINYSNDVVWKLWGNLEDAVREGTHRWKQTYGTDGPIFSNFFENEGRKREFLMGMHGFGTMSSPAVANVFDLSRFTTVADLGGATGHLTIALCKRWKHLKGIVFDLAAAVPLANEIVGTSGVADRIQVVAGDFFEDKIPSADLYTLGRILHDWSEAKCVKLLTRIYEALPKGGGLLLAEKLLLEDKSGPRWAQLQDLNMLTCTEGRERTLGEYEQLLKQIGFTEVTGCRTTTPIDVVLAVK